MNDIEHLTGRISDKFFRIKQNIFDWNFDKLTGIGRRRAHDKYSILELNIYTMENYHDKELLRKKYSEFSSDYYLNNFSFFLWNVPESQFPKDVYEFGKRELIKSIEATIDMFSLIKEQELRMVFEIVWAGYAITDTWGTGAVSGAFINAVLSCFDKKLYETELKYKQKHPLNSLRSDRILFF